ncbi:MAG: RidA family protein [Rhodospirillaceae bacterium]|nr:RidA family protein [Rhodospirillaceae bacterium]MDD9918466.1 RidA family protein [Rhodospirillaceae bacterium]MDD9930167.1 RidA family protein [Rhodospirillaceae bacterium]
MLKTYNPASISSSRSNYSHAVEVPPNARTLYISGQVPVAADGSTPEGIEDQVVLAFDNVQTVLAEAGMSLDDVVRVNVYLTDESYFPAFRDHRNRLFTDHKAASTAVAIAALAHPQFKVEIEAVAAKVD